MHVAPVDLRAMRQSGIVIRFTMLGPLAFVLAEIPSSGSAGTSLEQPCTQAHWGFVISGDLAFVTDRRRQSIPAGRAFHVPAGGHPHHFETTGAAVVAGFQPVEDEPDLSDDQLAARGFEIVAARSAPTILPPTSRGIAGAGEVLAESWPMEPYLMTRVRMGERSGYAAGWCDAPHWGLVTAGRFAIAWEDDVEIVSSGDVFHCPPGPPGHRIEAADPASFVDLTPVAVMAGDGRLADWRRDWEHSVHAPARGIAVAALG